MINVFPCRIVALALHSEGASGVQCGCNPARHIGIFRVQVLQALSSGTVGQIPENGVVLCYVKLSMAMIAVL